MRWLLVLAVLLPTIAAAKPSVAVAPFEDDEDNKVAKVVAKIVEEDGSAVTGPKDTAKAMDKLGLSTQLDKGDQKKLRKKLDVDVLIQGKVEGEDREKTLELRVSGKGIKTSRFKIEYRSTTSPKFRDEVREQLAKRLGTEGNEDEPEAEPPPEEEKPKKKKKKKRREEDEPEEEDDGPAPRHAVTQVAIRGNVGAGFARRGLTYDQSGAGGPPAVGTAGPSVRVEVEAYPASMDTVKSVAAGFGVYGHYDRTFLVGIDVPGTTKTATIAQQHYSIGARYRYAIGGSTIAAGVGYAGRSYVADRSSLGQTMLDMPDASYAGVAPSVMARIGATPMIGVFFGGQFIFLLKAGGITKDYGYAKTIAFDVAGGVDVMFAKHYGLRAAIELSQVGLKFSNPKRGVSAATDRTIGLVASFELLY